MTCPYLEYVDRGFGLYNCTREGSTHNQLDFSRVINLCETISHYKCCMDYSSAKWGEDELEIEV